MGQRSAGGRTEWREEGEQWRGEAGAPHGGGGHSVRRQDGRPGGRARGARAWVPSHPVGRPKREYPLGQSSGADHTFSPAQLGSVRVLMDLSLVRTVRVSGRRHALPPASTPDSRAWRLCRPVSSEANGEGGVGGRAECKCDRASYDARTGTVR